MTIRAGSCAVNSGQRPACGAVIKRRGSPGDCVVAGRAVRGCKGSARSWVSRIVGLLPGCKVTSGIAAIVRLDRKSIVAIDVAGGAARGFARRCELVRVGQGKTGAAVVENTVGPYRDGVTRGASGSGLREICRDVIGNISAESLRAVPSRQVTAQTIRGAQRVVVVDVARGAWRRCGGHVRASQSETG